MLGDYCFHQFYINIKFSKYQNLGNKIALKKIEIILKELSEHPYTGEGNPEQLKHELSSFWSRRINKKRPNYL